MSQSEDWTLTLTSDEARVVQNALAQWVDEYATIEDAETAERVMRRLDELTNGGRFAR